MRGALKKTGVVGSVPALLLLISCQPNASERLGNSVVQVWAPASTSGEPATLASSGVVDDGSHVLMLPDYVHYTPGPLTVVTSAGSRYPASVEAIDPRTGLTMLALNSAARLPVAALGHAPKPAGTVRTWDWAGARIERTNALTVVSGYTQETLFFSTVVEHALLGPVLSAGTVVTNEKDQALGMALPFHSDLAIRTGIPPPVVARIDDLAELLKPAASSMTWARGPALTAIASRGGLLGDLAGVLPAPSDYEQMTLALESLLASLGKPLTADGLDPNSQAWYLDLDGTVLIALIRGRSH